MRKFLNTLYVLNKDAYLSLEGENIVQMGAEIGFWVGTLIQHGEAGSATRLNLVGSRSTGWKASSASAIPVQALP